MKPIIFLLATLFIFVNAKSQTRHLDSLSSSLISNLILKNYHPAQADIESTCRAGIVMIKFKVDSRKKINQLAFSKDAPPFIVAALTQSIQKFQSDPKLMMLLAQNGKVILQPFIYEYQLGCPYPKPFGGETRELFYKKHYDILSEKDHHRDIIFNFLNFSDGSLTYLDCVILVPITVGALSD